MKAARPAIDLNLDAGESFGRWRLGDDETLLPLVTSVNVACGFHAGDPGTMRRTLRLARGHGVAVGAHPGLPDLEGFGRRELAAGPEEIEDYVIYQVGALAAMGGAEGVRLAHVKPHGALYHMATRRPEVAEAVARAVAGVDPDLILVGPGGSALAEAGRRAGLRTAAEAFADRAYLPGGSLVPRGEPGSVLDDPGEVARQAVAIAREGRVETAGGGWLAVEAQTICLHGDTPRAVEHARAVRSALAAAGVAVRPLREVIG